MTIGKQPATLSSFCFEVAHVAVLEALATRLRGEPHAVDDRRVVELVGNDRRSFVADRWEEPGIGVPARNVRERRLRPQKCGDAILERAVNVESAADKAHRRRSRAVLVETALSGFDDVRVVREAQVVVARKHDDVAGLFHMDLGRHRRRQVPEVFVRSGLLERVEIGLQLLFERLIHDLAASPLKSRTILAASPLPINSKARSNCV